jgi:hypothetical protein
MLWRRNKFPIKAMKLKRFHSLPIGDAEIHSAQATCWCHPTETDPGVWVHNAKDCREAHERIIGQCSVGWIVIMEEVQTTPDSELPPFGDGPRRAMVIEINVTEDFEKRLDNQWMVEREIQADRWSWSWKSESAKHVHVNNGIDDACKECGRDLRNEIHLRASLAATKENP